MRKVFLGAAAAIPIGIVLGFLFHPLISEDNIYRELNKFKNVLSTTTVNYVEDVDTHRLTEAAIKGMLEELDVHSVYISAEDMKRVKEDFQGSFEGIGIEFDIIEDTITVVSPIPGGPSEQLGIMSGDKILTIDGEDAIGIARSEVPPKLKGPKGTVVTVEIKRRGEDELLKYDITRDKIPLNSLEASFLIDGSEIGLVRINRFAATTYRELSQAITALKEQGMEKLILDLRGNPGGYLSQAVLMADEFISAGDTIVYTKGRRPEFDEAHKASPGGQFENLPLIVMIDGGSASASEIVSGAVQDLDRGLVIGETSYGKGLVQRQYPLSDGSAFRLTISKYYTPSGRSIQRPYKDKDDYRKLAGRLELEEGANLQHALEKAGSKIDMDSIPTFKTRGGRTVLGGGGITPDYIIKYDTLAPMARKLRNNNLFFYFASDYMDSKGDKLKSEYENDFEKFLSEFEHTESINNEFKKFLKDKDIEWDEEDYKIDIDFINNSLKASFARIIWDRNKSLIVRYQNDKMANKALTLFDEAERIAKIK
ncbi:MAG: S41 family peptidase [Bacteroidota bacterium]